VIEVSVNRRGGEGENLFQQVDAASAVTNKGVFPSPTTRKKKRGGSKRVTLSAQTGFRKNCRQNAFKKENLGKRPNKTRKMPSERINP